VFSVSIADIEKALLKQDKKPIDLYTSLLQYYHEFLDVFSPEEAKKLLPLYRAGIDYQIKLKKKDSKTLEVP
jgi:Ser/Thr protein kinase RdoA (MazF antagonist)